MRLLGGWEENVPYPFIYQKERLHFFGFSITNLVQGLELSGGKKKITKPDFPASGLKRQRGKQRPTEAPCGFQRLGGSVL